MRSLVLGVLVAISFTASAGSPISHPVEYFTRPNWPAGQRPAGVLCLTNGISRPGNPSHEIAGMMGHTALSYFETGDNEENHRMSSSDVTSWSSVPFAQADFGKDPKSKHDQVENYHVDNFLAMQNSTIYSKSTRHCVQISPTEKKWLTNFLAKKKNDEWSFKYNCGNMAIEAFMGILFPGRSLKDMRTNPTPEENVFMSHIGKEGHIIRPKEIFAAINDFQSKYPSKGTLSYKPGKEDVKQLEYLQTKAQITIPLFDDLPAAAAVPVRTEPPVSRPTAH